MKIMKKYAILLLALVLCLSLTACGDSNEYDNEEVGGTDWRTTGIWRGDGTITRDGEDIDVLVCIHDTDATFYYNTEDQELYGSVDYPITLDGNPWEMYQYIDFTDLNGDGNSDVTLHFLDGDNELIMVWFWDSENGQFMYQPDESQLGEEEGRGDLIPESEADDGQGDLILDGEGQGDLIQDDEGRGDLILEGDNAVPVLMGGAFPFTNMETLQSENFEDGTYYYADVTEDGLTIVVNAVLSKVPLEDSQTLEDYLASCALDLGDADSADSLTIELNDAYTENMTYPVYIVSYISGENEDSREWTVFAMDTDSYTYLYGFGTTLDAVDDDMKSIYQDIFAGLYLSDGE